MAQKSFPASAFSFLAPASIEPSLAETLTQRRFSGVAYSGEQITDHGYWGSPIVIDLSSTSCEVPAPLLEGHDPGGTIGVIESSEISSNLTIAGRLFADIDEDAAAIAEKADAGFPWQMSVGIYPGSIEEVPAGMTVNVNGRAFNGPINIFKNSRVREVSIVALGADPLTSARVFEQGDSISIQIEEPVMAEENVNQIEEEVKAEEVVTEEVQTEETPADTSEVDALKAELKAAREELAAFKTSQRKEKVGALFSSLGREMTDTAIEPYMTMTEAQFSAISGDMKALKPVPKAHLFEALQPVAGEDKPDMKSIIDRQIAQLSGKASA